MNKFTEAIQNNDINRLNLLLNNYQYINIANIDGTTLLYKAILYNKIDIVELLLTNGADVNIKNSDSFDDFKSIGDSYSYEWSTHHKKCPMDLANSNNKEIIKLFIQNGASPDFWYKNGLNGLYKAILDDDIEYAIFLLNHGADIEKKNIGYYGDDEENKDFYLLHKDKSIAELIFKKNANFNIIILLLKYNPLNEKLSKWLSRQNFKEPNIKMHIDELYSINPNGYRNGMRYLYYEIINKNINKIKQLLDSNADINLVNSTDYRDYENIDFYYENNKKTCQELSIEIGDLEIIKKLINNDDAVLNHFLCYTIKYEKDEISKFLIESSKDLNKRSILGYPLSFAVSYENINLVELLLQKGANPNAGFPLNTACKNQNLRLVKLLIENGADTNFVGHDGQTALFEAISATKANKEIIRFLIANGADIYKEDNNGISPLSFAESNKTSLVKVLTEHEEIKLSENKDPNIIANYRNLLEKIVLQNKVITILKDEINTIKNSATNHHTEEDYQLSINSLKETISSQAIEIKALQDKLIQQEQNTKSLIDDLILKINTLEEKFDNQQVMKVKKPIKFFSNKIGLNKEKNIKEYSDNGDDLVSIKKLESAEYARQIVLKAITEGHIGMMGGWVSSVALDRLLRLTDNEQAIPLNKRKELLKTLGYEQHPGLTGGRVNNGIAIDDGKKPYLYIQIGSELGNLIGQAEIVKAYIMAQHNANLDNNISKLVVSESENINVENNQYDGIKQNELLKDNEIINQLQEAQDVTKQHLSSEIVSLNQHTEINLDNNKLSATQEEAEKKIKELLLKIESLEKIAETEKKQPSKPTPLTQSFIERSLVKNDGIIVKRDSLDDF